MIRKAHSAGKAATKRHGKISRKDAKKRDRCGLRDKNATALTTDFSLSNSSTSHKLKPGKRSGFCFSQTFRTGFRFALFFAPLRLCVSLFGLCLPLKGRKPVRHRGQTGFLGHGGKPSTLMYLLSLNLCLKILSGDKLYRL